MLGAQGKFASILDDAQRMQLAAQDRLSAGDVRNAAENAWWAANFAAKALIVARTGVMPLNFRDTGRGLGAMASSEPGVRDLSSRYYSLRVVLHEECYDSGMCEPIEGTVRLIRETADLIQDAERLAENAFSRQEGNDSSASRKV
jgi:hypothetical protein